MTSNVLDPAEDVQLLSNLTLSSQNTPLSPILCLPDEMLAEVFLHSALLWYNLYVSRQHARNHEWVGVRHVCRRWDHIALNSPSLWSYVVPVTLLFTELSLGRSKQSPLKICIPSRYLRGFEGEESLRLPSLLEKLGNHAERIQELALDRKDMSMVLAQLFGEPSLRASRLRRLEVSRELYSDKNLKPYNLDTPALRVLHVDQCPTSWRSLTLSGLTTLSLNHVLDSCRQGVAEFLVDLSCMQSLRHLSLDNALSSPKQPVSSPTFHSQNVTLSHLSRLRVVAPASTIFALLSHIDIPMKTEVRIEVTCDSYDAYDHSLIAAVVHNLARRVNTAQSDRATGFLAIDARWFHCGLGLRFAGFEPSKRTVSESTRECFNSLDDLEWGCNVPLKIVVKLFWIAEKRGFRVLRDLCLSLPLQMIQHVCVENPPFSSPFWKNLLGKLSDMRSLELKNGCMPDFAAALSLPGHGDISNFAENGGGCRPVAHPSCSTSNPMIAPALEEIWLVDIDLFGGKKSLSSRCDAPDGPPTHVVNTQILCDVLASRRLQLNMSPEKLRGDRVSGCVCYKGDHICDPEEAA